MAASLMRARLLGACRIATNTRGYGATLCRYSLKSTNSARSADCTAIGCKLVSVFSVCAVDGQMRKSLISVFAGAGFSLAASGLALAADMVVKAPPPPPAPVYSWTGFYVGGNIGYSWGKASGDLSDPAIAFFSGLGSLPTSFSESLKPKGGIGGGQFGYNYQINPTWILGLEADLQASNEHASNSQSASTSGVFIGPGITGLTSSAVGTTFDARISWFGTARARAGVLITPTTLFYGTGGLAFGGVKVSGSGGANINLAACIAGIGCIPTGSASGAFAFNQSTTKTGWTLGGGVEGALTGNWTWKAEYLYLDLGTESGSVADNSGGIASWKAKFTDNIVRVGLNYKFGN
jgi:outer membrane immunogenic protein